MPNARPLPASDIPDRGVFSQDARDRLGATEEAAADYLSIASAIKQVIARSRAMPEVAEAAKFAIYGITGHAVDGDPNIQWRYNATLVVGYDFGPIVNQPVILNAIKPLATKFLPNGTRVLVLSFADTNNGEPLTPYIFFLEPADIGSCPGTARMSAASGGDGNLFAGDGYTSQEMVEWVMSRVAELRVFGSMTPPTGMKSLFDLAFWEARNETTSYSHGGAVATITDQSAAASNWTTSGTNRGTWKSTGASGAMLPNGYPFLRLDGSDDYYQRASTITANACTIIMVVRNYGGGTGYRCLFCLVNQLLMKSMGTNVWGFYSGSDIGYGSALSSGWSIIVARVTGTGYNNWDMMADGLMLNATTAGASAGKTNTYLGSNEAAPSQLADVDIAAFAIASSALSAANIAAATDYFRGVYFTP